MSKKLLYFLSGFSLVLFANANKLDDDTVALVNGKKITKGHLERTYQQNKMYISSSVVTKEKVLTDLINRELGIQKAKSEQLEKNTVVKEKMEDVLYHALISKDLENVLAKIKVSDKEVKSYYRKYPEYRTAHILLRMTSNPSENEFKAALAQAIKISKEIDKEPKKFDEYARKYSQSTNAKFNGDIGFQPAMRLAPQYFKAINGKEKGYITAPILTAFGYHIIKVLDVKPYDKINKEIYKKIIYDDKRDKILAGYFKRLRSNAKININKKLLN